MQSDLVPDFTAITALDANTLQVPFVSDTVRTGLESGSGSDSFSNLFA